MIIGECTGALTLIDDVIIHGKTKEEHDLNLRKLMETARTAGLTVTNVLSTRNKSDTSVLYSTRTVYTQIPQKWSR